MNQLIKFVLILILLTWTNAHAQKTVTPQIKDLRPDVACNAQTEMTYLEFEGQAFFPRPGAKLDKPILPTVMIGKKKYIPEIGGCFTPDGLCTELYLHVPRGNILPGTYPVTVTNPGPPPTTNKEQITLTIVAPPSIEKSSFVPLARQVHIVGKSFVVINGTAPTLKIGDAKIATKASECTPLAGPKEKVQVCTKLTAALPTSIKKGQAQLIIQNPAPAGCSSELANVLIR